MVCGEFGSPSLIPYNKGISFFNALLAILAVCFGIVGCVSYTNKGDAIIAAPWLSSVKEFPDSVTGDVDDEETSYTASGIRSFVMYNKIDDKNVVKQFELNGEIYFPNPQTYEECQSDENMDIWKTMITVSGNPDVERTTAAIKTRCEDCESASVGVITTCSFALIAAAVAFFGQILRATCDSAFAKDVAFVGGGASFLFGVISYATFGSCALASRDYATLTGAEGTYGVGAKLVAASFAMAVAVTLLTVVVPVPPAEKEEEAGKMVTKV